MASRKPEEKPPRPCPLLLCLAIDVGASSRLAVEARGGPLVPILFSLGPRKAAPDVARRRGRGIVDTEGRTRDPRSAYLSGYRAPRLACGCKLI